jgi:hypothetical protein
MALFARYEEGAETRAANERTAGKDQGDEED